MTTKFEQWAIVEVMGHARFAGWVTEQTIGGAALIRVDVPELDGRPAFCKMFGASAIYSITPVDEATARLAAGQFGEQPIPVYIPRALPAPRSRDEDDEDPHYDGHDGEPPL
jgi:hypothetical protein